MILGLILSGSAVAWSRTADRASESTSATGNRASVAGSGKVQAPRPCWTARHRAHRHCRGVVVPSAHPTTPAPSVDPTSPASTPTTDSPTSPSDPTTTVPPTSPPSTGTPTTSPTTPPATETPSTGSFPNASNTGASGTLTRSDGDRTVSTDGAVLEDLEIHGSVLIKANDVTLRNVKIVNNGFWPLRIQGSGAVIEDSTVIAGDDSQAAISGSFTGRRLDLSGAGDGIKMSGNSTLVDSYIHDLASFAGAHNDGIEATNAVNIRIVHNTILNAESQTSALMLSEYGSKADTNVLIQGNLFAGGGYTIYGGAPDTAQGHEVVDNVFSTRYFSRSGSYGPVFYWRSTGNTWSNNRWADGPNAGQLVNPA
jgi:hypothetical protein